jgi:hypothetical protein
LIALAACSNEPEAPAPPSHPTVAKHAPPRPAELTHVTIKALGMYCEESCPLRVRYALADIPVIYELGFDLTKESIFISYDARLGAPKQVTKPMLVAIKQSGFDPWLAKESWPEEATAQVVER